MNHANHKLRRLLPLLALAGVSLAAPAAAPGTAPAAPRAPAAVAAGPIDHSAFDRVLKKYVNGQGLVNYKALKADPKEFNQYLELLSKNPPAARGSKADQMAYWINAYNAFTIKLILEHYPLKSIKDIGSSVQIPFVSTPWAAKFFSIGDTKMSLDNIEHGVLRKKFNDPRIHFAVVCASLSCARLRSEAYTGEQLERQLDDQGRDFVNNPAKNKVGKTTAQLSKYFDWYKGDWNKSGQSVAAWVNKYATIKMDPTAKISFMDYNWKLNEQ